MFSFLSQSCLWRYWSSCGLEVFFSFSRYVPSIGAGGKRWDEEVVMWKVLLVRAKISFSECAPLLFPTAGWGLLWHSSQVQGFQRKSPKPWSHLGSAQRHWQGSPADPCTKFCLSLHKVCSFPSGCWEVPPFAFKWQLRVFFFLEFQVA